MEEDVNIMKLDTFKYNKEAGVLLSKGHEALMYIEGESGHVTFPAEAVWNLHKISPGTVLCFAHTHPIGMPDASALDMHMLETWAKVLYPFPARLSVITTSDKKSPIGQLLFSEKTYFARWQDKEDWLKDKTKERRVEIRVEKSDFFPENYSAWRNWIVDFSFKKL